MIRRAICHGPLYTSDEDDNPLLLSWCDWVLGGSLRDLDSSEAHHRLSSKEPAVP